MYLSGTLAKKVIEEKREHTLNFDDQKLYFSDGTELSYQGELSFPPFDKKLEEDYIKWQEDLILHGTVGLYKQMERHKLEDKEMALASSMMNKLMNFDRRYAFALYEGLSRLIEKMPDVYNYEDLLGYAKFVTYTEEMAKKENFNQIQFELAMKLFFAHREYDSKSVASYLQEISKIDLAAVLDKLDDSIYEIMKLGSFLAPERMVIFAKSIWENPELTKVLAPVVFLLNDFRLGRNFVAECRYIAENGSVEKVAKRNRIPENLLAIGINRFRG